MPPNECTRTPVPEGDRDPVTRFVRTRLRSAAQEQVAPAPYIVAVRDAAARERVFRQAGDTPLAGGLTPVNPAGPLTKVHTHPVMCNALF